MTEILMKQTAEVFGLGSFVQFKGGEIKTSSSGSIYIKIVNES